MLTVICRILSVQVIFFSTCRILSSKRSLLLPSRAALVGTKALREVGVNPEWENARGSLGTEWTTVEGKRVKKLLPQGLPGSNGHGAGNSQAFSPKTGPGRFQRSWEV